MRKTRIEVISLIAVIALIAFTGMVYADSLVPATPEVQSISTGTSIDAVGTVTETDAAAWTMTNNKYLQTMYILSGGISYLVDPTGIMQQRLIAGGGSISLGPGNLILSISIPESLLNEYIVPGGPGTLTWQDIIDILLSSVNGYNENILAGHPGLHTGALDPGEVQYTAVYNDQYSGVSGQQTFVKSMAVSTANKIGDQSNIKAVTNIQFIAIDTGRATRTEDLLIDGAGNSTDTRNAILCPFATATSTIIPPYCNIVQAGSAFDTTLTSTVTTADTRFVGTDSTFPVVLNYNINAQGITLGDQSAPMVGSASAFLKVHIQEARNASTTKSEDLVYSETTTASGLISKFSKDMHYQSGFNLI